MTTLPGLDYDLWWFLIFGAVISGYAILDGFDLGAGCLHLLLKRNNSRRIAMTAVGPIWDGNEVWLVIGGGALFAGFPVAYAAIFSALYIPFMIFMVGLIFRGIAIQFRDQEPVPRWERGWDIAYCLASVIISLSLGLMLGNVVKGIPLNGDKEFAGDWLTFFNPFAILVAITTTLLFMLHGTLYLLMKTEGSMLERLESFTSYFLILFMISFLLTSAWSILYLPYLNTVFHSHPWALAVPLLAMVSVLLIPGRIRKGRYRLAFVHSAVTIALLLVMIALDIFPNLLYSPDQPLNSITVYNGASSIKTMKILLIIALTGVPLAATYTSFVFWTFKGKIQSDGAK
jgi:cytochrome d ubiquinol oxidase subunit II